MTRKLKSPVLVFVVALVTGAMVASVASASSNPTYRTAGAPATITGVQAGVNVFHVPGAGTYECTSRTFHGAMSQVSEHQLKVHQTITGCKAFGFSNAHVNTTGCDYVFTTPTTGAGGTYHAQRHLVCSAGNSIKITPTVFGASVCSMEIGSHTAGGVADLKNEAGKVRFTWTLTNISHSAGCGAAAAADATLTGEALFAGSQGAFSVS
jgi:hypothetical protein